MVDLNSHKIFVKFEILLSNGCSSSARRLELWEISLF
jgi:hypothetical protein